MLFWPSLGFLNHVSLDSTFSTFYQYVDCHTQDKSTLALPYANAKDVYSATALPPLGRSDHNLVLLTSQYVPALQQQPVSTRTVRRWIQEASEAKQDCLNHMGMILITRQTASLTTVPSVRTPPC